MSYKYIKSHDTNQVIADQIRRKADNANIPFDEGNIDYQEYKAWIDAGNTPEAADQWQN